MDRNRANTISRRDAVQRAGALGLVTAIVWLAGSPARAQAGKLAKDAVRYVDKGDTPGKECDDCMHYLAPANARESATCKIVDGPISPHGHCLAFTPKAKPAP